MRRKILWYCAFSPLCIALMGILSGFITAETKTSIDTKKGEKEMSKTLIIYYSYTNHTKMIAERIQKAKGYDIVRLELVEAYPEDYKTLETLVKKQAEEEFTPEIKPINVDLSQYDTIILGTPVWWYTFTPAIRSFLKNNNLSNKTIIPYATHAGWLGHTFKDIKILCPKSNVKEEMAIQFSGDAKENKIVTSNSEIENWINKLK